MSKVVLQVIALVLKGVKGFVLDLPATSAPSDHLGHIGFFQDQIGHPTVVISYLFLIHYPIFKVIYPGAILRLRSGQAFIAIEGNLVDPFVDMSSTFHILCLTARDFAQLPLFCYPLHEQLMIIRLCCQDKVHPMVFELLDKGLLGIEAVTYDNDPQPGVGMADLLYQSLASIYFTILARLAISIYHRLRGQGDYLPTARMHQRCLAPRGYPQVGIKSLT